MGIGMHVTACPNPALAEASGLLQNWLLPCDIQADGNQRLWAASAASADPGFHA